MAADTLFVADQCTDERYQIKHTKSGEKVIVDREATVEYIFNIYYWYPTCPPLTLYKLMVYRCVNVGALAGIATTFMEKDIGFWAAFLMPTAFFAVGIVLFQWNGKHYGRFSLAVPSLSASNTTSRPSPGAQEYPDDCLSSDVVWCTRRRKHG